MEINMEINIVFDLEFKGLLKSSWLKRVAQKTLKTQGICGNVELGLVITSREKIRQLNQRYRGESEPTDVLAFSTEGPDVAPFIVPPDGVRHLGEVIISYPQAVIQAEEHQHSVEREIAILVIHGVLHLLGYEHDEPSLEHEMRAKEAEILGGLNI